MTAISRSKTNIYIVDAGTASSALATTDIFKGDIKSYSKSGGENDVESDPVFGGFVNKEKPISQVELAFEIIPLLDTGKVERWDAMAYSEDVANAGIYTMASETSTQADTKMIVIEAGNATDGFKTIAYNNCFVTVLDLEHNADDNRTYNMTLKFSPTDDNGVSNFMTSDLAATAMPAWTALDNN
jgi:hypothetical protein